MDADTVCWVIKTQEPRSISQFYRHINHMVGCIKCFAISLGKFIPNIDPSVVRYGGKERIWICLSSWTCSVDVDCQQETIRVNIVCRWATCIDLLGWKKIGISRWRLDQNIIQSCLNLHDILANISQIACTNIEVICSWILREECWQSLSRLELGSVCSWVRARALYEIKNCIHGRLSNKEWNRHCRWCCVARHYTRVNSDFKIDNSTSCGWVV